MVRICLHIWDMSGAELGFRLGQITLDSFLKLRNTSPFKRNTREVPDMIACFPNNNKIHKNANRADQPFRNT